MLWSLRYQNKEWKIKLPVICELGNLKTKVANISKNMKENIDTNIRLIKLVSLRYLFSMYIYI